MIERLASFLKRRGVDLGTFGAVFDIGSRDGLQAVELASLFPNANVVAIECNAQTLDKCRHNTAPYQRIRLVEKAINSHTGRCKFYPIDPARTVTTWADGNPGASSLFLATGDYPAEQYAQNEVEVECVRLDDLCRELSIDMIDLVWMDLQGAELLALESAGPLLDKVRYIFTEVAHRPLYRGQCLFDDVDTFLKARGFRLWTNIDRTRWQQDLLYENTREPIDVVVPFGQSDRNAIERSVRSVRRFVRDVRHIFLVGAENPGIDGVRFVDETASFDIDAVGETLGPGERTERYFQQLIKLYFPLVTPLCLEHVLAVDANTVFLRPCRFIADGRTIFNFGDEGHPAHFAHMTRLHPALQRMFAYSGITDCMLFKRTWLAELHQKVEAHHVGLSFWEAYLRALDPRSADPGASEYETYFSFCLNFHAADLIIRRLRWRNAATIDEVQLDRLDYVSLHQHLRMQPIDWKRLDDAMARDD